jgi:molybdopterin/thiamine biosynthesis adenylyltransferase
MTRHLNQSGLLSQETMDNWAVGIIGTGAIGSFVAMALTKMGIKNMVTWDPDTIEEHNIANQVFPVESVGKRKAVATRDMVKQFSGESIISLATVASGDKAYNYLVNSFPSKKYLFILCVDSLDVRKKLADELAKTWGLLVIDARMGAKTYRVLAMDTTDSNSVTDYFRTLVPDADAVQEPCGQKSIIYTVLGVAAEVCSFVHKIIQPLPGGNGAPLPEPVTFDYGCGLRLQRRVVGELVKMNEASEVIAETMDAVLEQIPF